LSHILLILKIYTTFKDVQMILKRFFDISPGFRFSKISVECSVYSCSCPWLQSMVSKKNINLMSGLYLNCSSKCLPRVACLWIKISMFQRAGMRKGGLPLPSAFQYSILMIWRALKYLEYGRKLVRYCLHFEMFP
jgi:hypothetical protein